MFTSLVIFHYHLLPGGVTQVISQSIQSVLLHIPEIKHILVVTGREENAGRVLAGIKSGRPDHLSFHDTSLEWKTVPEFDYLDERNADQETYAAIKKSLEELSGENLWWVHNFHIGKNPLFTRALLEIAGRNNGQKMLLHIHDFPECSRFYNLSFLARFCSLPLYPDLPNVRYCVINQRDRNLLISAGLRNETVFLLHDPVPRVEPFRTDAAEARERVNAYGKQKAHLFRPGGKLIFYPVRTIRRKNVLEAVLTAEILREKVNLVVTLPGVSATERTYSALVESCFSRKLVPGLFGTGKTGGAPGFEELIAASHMVLSSSVQEGFGYLFLNALQWGRPLVSRYLEILKGIEKIFTGHPHFFYSEISVPLSRGAGKLLREKYFTRLKKLSDIFSIEAQDALADEVENLTGGDTADFSYFSPPEQLEIILKMNDCSYKKETQNLNKRVIDSIESLFEQESVEGSRKKVEQEFGLRAFAAELNKVFDSFFVKSAFPAGVGGSQDLIIRAFATLENLRLLYE